MRSVLRRSPGHPGCPAPGSPPDARHTSAGVCPVEHAASPSQARPDPGGRRRHRRRDMGVSPPAHRDRRRGTPSAVGYLAPLGGRCDGRDHPPRAGTCRSASCRACCRVATSRQRRSTGRRASAASATPGHGLCCVAIGGWPCRSRLPPPPLARLTTPRRQSPPHSQRPGPTYEARERALLLLLQFTLADLRSFSLMRAVLPLFCFQGAIHCQN